MPRNNSTREHLLAIAERLFAERGYRSVRVKELAREVGLHHASLYHHAPGGKEGLYVEVMERNARRHDRAMREAHDSLAGNLRSQLHGFATWLLSQPPMDLTRIVLADFPVLSDQSRERLSWLLHGAVMLPIGSAIQAAIERGEVTAKNPGNVAGAFFSAIQGLFTIPDEYVIGSRLQMAEELIEVFVRGIEVRNGGTP